VIEHRHGPFDWIQPGLSASLVDPEPTVEELVSPGSFSLSYQNHPSYQGIKHLYSKTYSGSLLSLLPCALFGQSYNLVLDLSLFPFIIIPLMKKSNIYPAKNSSGSLLSLLACALFGQSYKSNCQVFVPNLCWLIRLLQVYVLPDGRLVQELPGMCDESGETQALRIL